MSINSMRLLTAVVGAALAAGCATVSSQHIGQGDAFDSALAPFCDEVANPTGACRQRGAGARARPGSAGVAYFLPRQLARVTATRTNSALDAKIKAVLEAQGAVEAAQAAIDAANAAIHAAENAIIAGSGGAAAAPILAARLTAQRAELATATQALPAKKAALEQAKAALRAVAEHSATSGQATGPGAYKVVLKIELLPPSADPAHAYVLSPHHSPFRDDEHRLVVSPGGLLTSTEVVAVDRTADILLEIATFAGAITGAPVPFNVSGRSRRESAPRNCTGAPNEFTGVVDFADPGSVALLNFDLQCIGVRMQATGRRWPEGTRPTPTSPYGVDGIVYRTPVEVLVRVERCVKREGNCTQDSPEWFPTEVIALSLPQAGPISYVRQDAGFMTRTRYALAFSNGMLTNYDASRPSELLEVARTPMRLVQGVFDGASRIISLRTGQNNALAGLSTSQLAVQNADFALRAGQITGQTGLTNAQLAALNAEYALRAAQISGETGLTNAQLAALNAEFALRAAQLSGQTSLTNAELAALNAQFALQGAQISGQTGLTSAQLGLLQSQGALTTGTNNAAAQASASNLALHVSLLRDQARREALHRCIAQQMGLGQPIDSCLIGF